MRNLTEFSVEYGNIELHKQWVDNEILKHHLNP